MSISREAFEQAYSKMAAECGRATKRQDPQPEAWYQRLRDFEEDVVLDALNRVVLTSGYIFPSLQEVFKLVYSIAGRKPKSHETNTLGQCTLCRGGGLVNLRYSDHGFYPEHDGDGPYIYAFKCRCPAGAELSGDIREFDDSLLAEDAAKVRFTGAFSEDYVSREDFGQAMEVIRGALTGTVDANGVMQEVRTLLVADQRRESTPEGLTDVLDAFPGSVVVGVSRGEKQ